MLPNSPTDISCHGHLTEAKLSLHFLAPLLAYLFSSHRFIHLAFSTVWKRAHTSRKPMSSHICIARVYLCLTMFVYCERLVVLGICSCVSFFLSALSYCEHRGAFNFGFNLCAICFVFGCSEALSDKNSRCTQRWNNVEITRWIHQHRIVGPMPNRRTVQSERMQDAVVVVVPPSQWYGCVVCSISMEYKRPWY